MSKHWNPGCAMKNCMTVICKHADGALPELRHFKLALYRVPALFMVIPYNYLGGRERCQFLQVQQLRLLHHLRRMVYGRKTEQPGQAEGDHGEY